LTASIDFFRDLPQAMGGQNIVQMDQTKLVDQTFLRQLHQLGGVTNLDRCLRLSHNDYRQQTTESANFSATLAHMNEVNMFGKIQLGKLFVDALLNFLDDPRR
jgi:hypothetical protein